MFRVTKKLFQILSSSQRRVLFLLVFLMLIGGALESLGITLILPLVSVVMDGKNWDQASYVKFLCDTFHISSQVEYIKLLIVLLIIVFLLKNVYLIFQLYFQNSYVNKSRVTMQRKLLHRYLHKPYNFYLNASTGEILRIVNSDSAQCFYLLTNTMNFYTEIVVCAILGTTIMLVSPLISFGLIFILLIELFIIAKVIKPIMKIYGENLRRENALTYKWLLQAVGGIKSIKVANTSDFFEDKYSKHACKASDIERVNATISGMPRLLIEAFTMTAILGILLLLVSGGLSLASLVPQLSAFVFAAVRILPSVNRISVAINQVPYFEGSLDNILKVLNDFEDKLGNDEVKTKEETIPFESDICLNHITFSYTDEKNILEDVYLRIPKGQSVGVVGPSGAGKTTMIDVILGLLKPQEGQILIDDVDIESNMSGWLRRTAYIPQNIFLMDDTIRENIAFGMHSKDIDDEKVWDALRGANLDSFVREMPEGIYSMIGEAGIRLSGGQRQRLGIARALYNNPEILFLDEATSALDNETEAAIMESIENLKGKKTIIIIAHRLTTIENCDVVYRVENGQVTKER